MTVDDLLARKRELFSQRDDCSDELERAVLEEEIRDINAQLRSLRGGVRSRGVTHSKLSMDRGQYVEWMTAERDDEMREAHQTYIKALTSGMERLTDRQREMFALWQSGVSATEIASRIGVDISTVSRTITRCKTHLRKEAADLAARLKVDGMQVFDLADRNVAMLILSCLTSRQAVCIYLYYGEWLNLRDCGELLGVDHTAVLRTVQRALRAIGDTMGCESFTLDNADALSDLAYELYLEQGMPPEPDAPMEKGAWGRRKLGYAKPHKRDYRPVPLCTVRTSDGYVNEKGKAHESIMRPMSKLLTLLFELRAKGTLFRWLEAIFQKFTKTRRGKKHVIVRAEMDN